MGTLDPAFGHWLAGFIAGEGCFSISATTNRAKRRQNGAPGSTWYNARLAVRLRDDDAAILYEIQARTGWGYVWHRAQTKAQGNSRPQAEWVVTRKGDLEELVYFLDYFPLRAKKADAYAVWSAAVLWWSSQHKHGGNARMDWSAMIEFREQLRLMNGYCDPSTGDRTPSEHRGGRPRTRRLPGRDFPYAEHA